MSETGSPATESPDRAAARLPEPDTNRNAANKPDDGGGKAENTTAQAAPAKSASNGTVGDASKSVKPTEPPQEENRLSQEVLEALAAGRYDDPFAVLGPHTAKRDGQAGRVVRCYVPDTKAAELLLTDRHQTFPMTQLHPAGVYEAWLPLERPDEYLHYRLRLTSVHGDKFEMLDSYAFGTTFGEMDLHLLGEGTHYKNYERLGSHLTTVNGVAGVVFAVWAPNAKRVSVVGDFNHWDGRRHTMRKHPGVGIWEIFIPGLEAGTVYKYEIISGDGRLMPLRTDPYGFCFELRPKTAAVVYDLDGYEWHDKKWMEEKRAKANAFDAPISVYEVHLGSWKRDPNNREKLFTYRELAHQLLDYVVEMGFTHIQLMPVAEHPFDGSWGYQVLGYFAPTSRYGTPHDFMYFVDQAHQRGIGVLVDWVPGHFPRDDHGLRQFDGTALYEHMDPRQGEHPEWGTMIFNYGRNEVSNFLLGNVLFWLDRYHIDGIRVDAVASMLYLDYGRKHGEWIPNRYGGNENLEAVTFIRRFNELVHQHHPGTLTIAEESTAWGGVSRPTYDGGLGFSLKWNMGWMNDTLRYFHRESIHRKYHQNDLTFSLVYAFSENFMLPLSHDEVVHGKGALLDKMPGDFWQRFANLRLLFGYMWTHPGKNLLFMGGEFGQWQEWRYYQSLDWHLTAFSPHRGVMTLIRDLNALTAKEPALHQCDFSGEGFEWVDHLNHQDSVLAFLRKGRNPEDTLVVCCNFTPVVREHYRIGMPKPGFWEEVMNTDSGYYGGSNCGNAGGRLALPRGHHGRPASMEVTLPPLGVTIFKLDPSRSPSHWDAILKAEDERKAAAEKAAKAKQT